MGAYLSNSSNQRKLAVLVAASLALFSEKIPVLANVNPEFIMGIIGTIAAWILQSGVKAAATAHAAGVVEAAKVNNAADAAAVLGATAVVK